jgi:heparosan-N-sulfate-glucuronate 5-epimerase
VVKIITDIKKSIIGSRRFRYIKSDSAGHYPIDYTWLNSEAYFKNLDSTSVPLRKVSGKMHYVPSGIAGNALRHHSNLLSGKISRSRDLFIKHSDWFLQHTNGMFPNTIPIPRLGLAAPWYSCLSQGLGISVLLRAWKITGDQKYLLLARKAIYCLYPDSEYQLCSSLDDGGICLEEYPCQNPSHVINGFLAAIIGIHEFSCLTGDARANNYLIFLSKTVAQHIELWDSNGWSLYEAKTSSGKLNYNTVDYHNLQIAQFRWLLDRYSNQKIQHVVDRWISSSNRAIKRLMALYFKTIYKLDGLVKNK